MAEQPQDAAPSDVRDKFREALQRKNASTKAGEDHTDARSKNREAHGPIGAKREFRRKSG